MSRLEAVVDSNRRLGANRATVHTGVLRNRQGADVCVRREGEVDRDPRKQDEDVRLWQNCRIGADMVGERGQRDALWSIGVVT